MAPRREDRLLMRQRGAATRQVKNAGFNLVLPGQEQDPREPLQPRRSGRVRKTPQAELVPQHSTRGTPAPEELRLQLSTTRTLEPDALLSQTSLQHTLAKGAAPKRGRVAVEEGTDLPDAITTQDEGGGVVTNTKKRKLKKGKEMRNESTPPEVQVQDSQPVEPDLSIKPSSGVKRRKKRKSIGQQSMKPKPKNTESLLQGGRQPQKRVPKSKLRLPAEPSDSLGTQLQQEVQESIETSDQAARPQQRGSKRGPDAEGGRGIDAEVQGGTTFGKRKRKTVVAQPKKRLKSGKANGKDIQHAQEEDPYPEPEAPPILDRNADVVPDSTGVVVEEPRSKPKPKRRKRRSIGQQSVGRQKGKKKSTSLDIPVRPASKKQPKPKLATQLEAKNVETAIASRATASPRRRPQTLDDEPPIDEEGESIPDSEPEAPDLKKRPAHPNKEAAPPHPKPTAASKLSRLRPQKPKPQRPPCSRSPRAPPKNTIPITIYRPLSPGSITSTSDPTSDVFSDPLTDLPQLPPAQPTLTAPSILSQMTRELLSKTTTSLTSLAAANPTQRSALQRRKKTVEAYGAELEARLIQLTRAVGENEVLSRRVRECGKEERELRRTVGDVEGERERIRVRREEALREREKGRLERLLKGIEGVVLRGWEMQWREKEAVLGD